MYQDLRTRHDRPVKKVTVRLANQVEGKFHSIELPVICCLLWAQNEDLWATSQTLISVAWRNSRHFATLPLLTPRNDVSGTWEEIPYWWLVSTYIWIVLLIGCAAKDICLNQSEALPSQIWVVTRHQCGMFAVDPHTLFRGKTRDGVSKCRLFCQVILNGVRLRLRGRLPYIQGCVDEGLLSLLSYRRLRQALFTYTTSMCY